MGKQLITPPAKKRKAAIDEEEPEEEKLLGKDHRTWRQSTIFNCTKLLREQRRKQRRKRRKQQELQTDRDRKAKVLFSTTTQKR